MVNRSCFSALGSLANAVMSFPRNLAGFTMDSRSGLAANSKQRESIGAQIVERCVRGSPQAMQHRRINCRPVGHPVCEFSGEDSQWRRLLVASKSDFNRTDHKVPVS
ncbi:MAG: hypothetical protein ACTSSQ_00190 [Alphaproteobacteria bacterium]